MTELPPADQARVRSLVQSLIPGDRESLSGFGAGVQGRIAQAADQLLHQTRKQEADKVEERLGALLTCLKSSDTPSASRGWARIPLVGRLFLSPPSSAPVSLLPEIEALVGELEATLRGLEKSLLLLEHQSRRNLELLRDLDLHILAAKELLQSREQTQPRHFTEALERRLQDLQVSRLLALHDIPRIRLLQENGQLLSERIRASLVQVLPLWKRTS